MKTAYLENRTTNPKTGKQHSKFYRMTQINGNTFEVTYGPIGRPGKTLTYDMWEWDTILTKKMRGGYEPVEEGKDDFQSQLDVDAIVKLEKLQMRVQARGVKTDIQKVQTMINKYRRFGDLDKELANELYTKYSKKNVDEKKAKKLSKFERKVEYSQDDDYVTTATIVNFDPENGFDPEISEDEGGIIHVIFPEFPPALLEDFSDDFDDILRSSFGEKVDVDWADREYFIIEGTDFEKVVEFFMNFKVDA